MSPRSLFAVDSIYCWLEMLAADCSDRRAVYLLRTARLEQPDLLPDDLNGVCKLGRTILLRTLKQILGLEIEVPSFTSTSATRVIRIERTQLAPECRDRVPSHLTVQKGLAVAIPEVLSNGEIVILGTLMNDLIFLLQAEMLRALCSEILLHGFEHPSCRALVPRMRVLQAAIGRTTHMLDYSGTCGDIAPLHEVAVEASRFASTFGIVASTDDVAIPKPLESAMELCSLLLASANVRTLLLAL